MACENLVLNGMGPLKLLHLYGNLPGYDTLSMSHNSQHNSYMTLIDMHHCKNSIVILTLEYGYLSFIQHLALNRCKECAA